MTPPIGALRRRVTIEAATDSPDGAGGLVRDWVTLGEVFARVTPRRRREAVDDGRRAGLVTHLVTIRHREDVTGHVRFSCEGVTFRVLAVEAADPTGRFLDCWCEEEQA